MDNNNTNQDKLKHGNDPNEVVKGMLEDALNTHRARRAVYERSSQNVFKDTAMISSIILRKELTAFDITMIFTVMKMARYGNIFELLEIFQDDPMEVDRLTKTIKDSALDGMVYMALTERERQNLVKVTETNHVPSVGVQSMNTQSIPKTSSAPLCSFFSWKGEERDSHTVFDISSSCCNHPRNNAMREGNCNQKDCPVIRRYPDMSTFQTVE